VAIILIIGYQSFKAIEKAAFDEFNQRQLVLAREATGGLELYFENLASDMRALARLPEIQQFDEIPTRREMQYMLYELEPWGVNDIAVLDADGVVKYNAVAHQLEGVDFSWRNYFQEARELTSGDTYIVEFIEFKGVEAGQKGVLVAAPMFETTADGNPASPSGQFAGVVVSTLKLDTITQKFITPIQASEDGHAFLIDDEYNVLWAPDNSLFGKNLLEAAGGFPTFQQIVEKMASGNAGTSEYLYYKFENDAGRYTEDEEESLIAYAPIRLGEELWSVGVWAPKEDARQLVRSAYFQQLVVVGLSVLIIFLGSAHSLAVSLRMNKFLKKEVELKSGALHESEDRYRKLVELSPDAIAVQSQDKIIFMNGAGAELFGAENPEQLIGKSVWDFVLPEYREIVKARYRQLRGDGIIVPPIEQKFVRLDGTLVDVEVVATSLIYEGKPAIQAIFHDITRRKQVERALEAAYSVQQAIIDGITEPTTVIGADYQVKLMNCAAREFSIGDAVASEPLYCYQISHQREVPCKGIEHPCPMERVRELGQPITVVHKHYHATGEERFVELTASPIWGADGTFQGIVETVRDITDRMSIEETLTQQEKEWGRSDDELEEFTHKVARSLQDFFTKLE
jgi:PAS domain S-box-containing protein